MTSKPSEYAPIIEDLLNGQYEQYDIDEIVEILTIADDDYTNEGEGNQFELTDPQYDAIKIIAKRIAPAHLYFTGVGSDVRGSKVDLPNAMPSLDQVEIGEVVQWVRDNNLDHQVVAITDKMDGTSLQLIYDKNGELQIAYSRGNGLQGADVTRHVRRMKNIPTTIAHKGGLEVRAEVELSETAFRKLQMSLTSQSGKRYKNARNMVAGQMNREESYAQFYEHVNVFAYEVLNTAESKVASLDLLESLGFSIANYYTFTGEQLNDEMLSAHLSARRESLDFAIDGIVITVNNCELKRNLDSGITGKSNPKSSVKYKVADASNYHIATCSGVTYNISKHGFRKPTINFVPFDLMGVTISNATGFNAAFIRDNGIGEGAQLLMTRSGDVIPYVIRVHAAVEWQRPFDQYEDDWTETGVDLVLKDPDSCPEVRVQRIIDFCMSMDFPMLKEGNVRALFDAGYDTLNKILTAEQMEFTRILGSNGVKVYEGIRNKLTNVRFHDLLGSTCYFGRGVGKRKFKKLLAGVDLPLVNGVPDLAQLTVNSICSVPGFQTKTAHKILLGLAGFLSFYDDIREAITVAAPIDTTVGKLAGQKIVFTGFRDAALHSQVELLGGEMQSSASGKTTIVVASDPNSNSGKLKKARDNGTRIMGIDEFKGFVKNA